MLAKSFNVQSDNWMSDPRFGNIDRHDQIRDYLNKYIINEKVDYIPNYSKQGVLFKHMTPILTDPHLLTTMFDLLERFIQDNFDINKIDYFAGLDARGFYFAPVLARTFKKDSFPLEKQIRFPSLTHTKS